MTVDERELEDILKSFDEFSDSISDIRIRRKAMLKAAQVVKRSAQSYVKDSEKEHYRYDTPKLIGRLRAKKGSGRIKEIIQPGNLRRSIIRLEFKKTFRVFVGPRIYQRYRGNKRLNGVRRNAIAYYAAMSRGKNSDGLKFRKEIMEKGLRSSAGRARKAAENEVDKQIAKLKRQTGL